MREIRFRIWSPIKDQMVYSDLKRDEMNLTTAVAYHNTHPEKGHLMQFTGLRDKNGKEVYEGDVISDHIGIGDVEYPENVAAFRVNYRNGQAKWLLDYNLPGEFESIEVIGNVHEHPELLK